MLSLLIAASHREAASTPFSTRRLNMHKELAVKTPSLSGSSELLVIAPIKPGFVPALDAVTYTSRAKLLLRTLHAARKNAHEYNLFRAVSDAVERVGVIHTLRVAVLEPDEANTAGSILLSVNFDGAYEAYVRAIWQKSARLLDLIFCNTVDHVSGWDHSYEAWSRWLQSRQVDTPFYYSTPSLTKGDATALRMQDRFQRREADVDLLITQTAITNAEHIAWELVEKGRDPQSGPFSERPSGVSDIGTREGVRQGLQGLAGVYRLADLYTPGTHDGGVLKHAAYELLPEFVRMWESGSSPYINAVAGDRLRSALQWLSQRPPYPAVRESPALPSAAPTLPPRAQAGILRPVVGATRACVCLVSFDNAVAAAAFLREFMPTAEFEPQTVQRCVNVALTFEGLRACGVSERVLSRLPIEFQQGMQHRAGVLGDLHTNHPRRWVLPTLNWPAAVNNPASETSPNMPAVAIESVHALLHVRVIDMSEQVLGKELKDRFETLGEGVTPLSVQWLRRNFNGGEVADHFGFRDVESDPQFGPDEAYFFPNQVHVGEALVGHANAADALPTLGNDLAPLLQDASYLVVRKLKQDVDAFKAAVEAVKPPLDADLVKAKLIGRYPNGTPLIKITVGSNDFNYDKDTTGSDCPFAAHIRRANPRVSDGEQPNEVIAVPGARPPRLFRRGMSYADNMSDGSVEKGLFFMAYNARIGEQFEVVQRWLTGGNSSGAASGNVDPICGLPEPGRRRFFPFEHEGSMFRLPLDGDDDLSVEAQPLVRLAWGSYFLAPSLNGVEHLIKLATTAAHAKRENAPVNVPWNVAEGLAAIKQLRALETKGSLDVARGAWKAALEDSESRREFRTASIWAAIREAHGGVLRTPYGVLVADGRLVDQVLTDVDAHYSVKEYQTRLDDTIGPIFLGLDAGTEYDRQALACNNAIMKLTFEDGYLKARQHTQAWLQTWVTEADQRASGYGESRWELNVDIRDINWRVLAALLEDWFGLKTGGPFLVASGFEWAFDKADPARYPGAFYTPSRYTFQPQPSDTVRDIAKQHGQHLRERMTQFLAAEDAGITAPVARAVLDDTGLINSAGSKDYDLAACTVSGAIMGFVPTTDNNLRRIVDEWLRDQTVWNLRARTGADSLASPSNGKALLSEPVVRTMMLRPMPEFIWRTATKAHALHTTDGGVFNVDVDDLVVLGLVSATQQMLENGERDVVPVFGGDRWASIAPRHACPGMPSAMGVMAGVLSAIIDTPLALRPSGTRGLLTFEGPVTPLPVVSQPGLTISKRALDASPADFVGTPFSYKLAKAPAVSKGTLLAWGDSWFNLDIKAAGSDRWDFAQALAKLGWDTSSFVKHSTEGLKLKDMASVGKRKGFYRTVQEEAASGKKPVAILIDGGGNDVHWSLPFKRSPLHDLAAPAGSTSPLVADAVHKFIHVQLRSYLDTVLTNLCDVTKGSIPILVHGYDYPIPDGRGFKVGSVNISWLDPVNETKLYSLEQGAEIMRLLIDELNLMIGYAAAPFAGRGVRHLKLTGTIASQAGYTISNHKPWWLNELHPTQLGYDALAAVVESAITAAMAPAPP
jgi:deferrochelatase/peroxidase EfeB